MTKSVVSIYLHRFGGVFESVIEELLVTHREDSGQLEILREIMSLSSQPMKFEIVPNASTNLFLGLNHAQSSMRLLSVQHLVTCINRSDVKDKAFVEDMLLLRLADENMKVVTAVLQLKDKLSEVVDGDKLCTALNQLVGNCRGKSQW